MQNCRICKNINLVKVLELGYNALANSFLKKEDFSSEKVYPLDIYFCKDCKKYCKETKSKQISSITLKMGYQKWYTD